MYDGMFIGLLLTITTAVAAAMELEARPPSIFYRTVSADISRASSANDYAQMKYPSLLTTPVVRREQELPYQVRAVDIIEPPSPEIDVTIPNPSYLRKFQPPRAPFIKINENDVLTPRFDERPCNCDGNAGPEVRESQTYDDFNIQTSKEVGQPHSIDVVATTSREFLQPKTNKNTNNTFDTTERNALESDKTSSGNKTVTVDLDERSSFQVDECASDAVKVNGKCVKKE